MVHTFLREEKYAKEALPALTRYLLRCFSLSENFLEGLYTLKTEQSYSQAIFRGYLTFKVKPSAY